MIHYCPDWTAGAMPGHPKKNNKEMMVMDHNEASSKKCKVVMYCSICEKFNHTTFQCFKNPLNCKLDKKLQEMGDKFEGEDGEEGRV